MQVNHLSQALLYKLLKPSLEAAGDKREEARVVTHSSGARFFPLGKHPFGGKHFEKCEKGSLGGDSGGLWMSSFKGGQICRYVHTKLANAIYAMALHDELQAAGSKIKSLTAEPGLATTSLASNGFQVKGGKSMSQKIAGSFIPLFKMLGQTGGDGACPFMMACFAADAQSGDFFVPSKRYFLPPILMRIYTKGMPKKTVKGGVPVTKGYEKRSTSIELKKLCLEVTAAAIA